MYKVVIMEKSNLVEFVLTLTGSIEMVNFFHVSQVMMKESKKLDAISP